jgi:hypothetical protein
MVSWKIGPTFVSELEAAGVPLEGYSWDITAGTFSFSAGVPETLVDQVAAVYAAHDPAAQTDPPTPYPPGAPTQLPAQHAQPLPGPK